MALVTMKELLKESIAKKYAIGGFGATDHLYAEIILNAAEETGRPVVMMVPPFLYDVPHFERIMKYFVARCEQTKVPVALHLDHGSTFESVMLSIHHGCTSVMYDGSSLPFEENVERTREVVRAAHACGVSVEAEIGHVSGHEGNMLEGNEVDHSAYTQVDEAVRFVKATGVDALAIAVGTVHGVYKGEPKLDFERIKEIRSAVDIPLVLHGGSGLSPEMFREAVTCGINKINFCTEVSLAAGQKSREYVQAREGKNIAFDALAAEALAVAKQVIKDHIEIFGTQPINL